MVFGNPSCFASAQNCYHDCCNTYRACPSYSYDCRYYYYTYGTTNTTTSTLRTTSNVSLGVGIGVGVFMLIVFIVVGVVCYRRRRAMQFGLAAGNTTTIAMAAPVPSTFGMGGPVPFRGAGPYNPPPVIPMNTLATGNNIAYPPPSGQYDPWQQGGFQNQDPNPPYNPTNPISVNLAKNF
jgi:hypothetical protein